MNFAQIRLICVVLTKTIFIIVPFLAVFRGEWRCTMSKIVGIFMGYLFFVYPLGLTYFRHYLNRPQLEMAQACTTMTTNVLICRRMVRTDRPVSIYSLSLFRSLTDTAAHCADLSNAPAPLYESSLLITRDELLDNFIFLFLTIQVVYYILRKYLTKAVKCTRPPPVRNYLAAIPVLFFIMFRLVICSLSPPRIFWHHPDMAFFAVCWFVCIYTVHYVSLRILSWLAESYTVKEQYRTIRLLANVQKSQIVMLQYNLGQFKKVRHDCRHRLITIKGLSEQEEADPTLEYINDYLNFYTILKTTRYCQSPSSNMLLSYYIQTAQTQETAVNFSISLPQSLFVPEIDFCTILGNLLFNAIEACQGQTQETPSITINIGQAGKSMIVLSIQNTYSYHIQMKGGHFLSFKREDMGIGVTSARYLAEWYHGILKFDYSSGIFEVFLFLNPAMKQLLPASLKTGYGSEPITNPHESSSYSSVYYGMASTSTSATSASCATGVSITLILKPILWSTSLKSTTLASISWPILKIPAGFSTCSLETWDT